VPEEAETHLHVYPNPGSGLLTFAYAGATGQAVGLSVRNLTGQVVYERRFGEFLGETEQELDLRHLPPGTYLLTVQNGARTDHRPFVIVR
jgi:hypothetical protein